MIGDSEVRRLEVAKHEARGKKGWKSENRNQKIEQEIVPKGPLRGGHEARGRKQDG